MFGEIFGDKGGGIFFNFFYFSKSLMKHVQDRVKYLSVNSSSVISAPFSSSSL